MSATARKNTRRAGKRKKKSNTIGAWVWLLGGILIGLGFAVVLMLKGFLPELTQHSPSAETSTATQSDDALVDGDSSEAEAEKRPRYDFFTVLPEMEVVVPEQELARTAAPAGTPAGAGTSARYILQAGSFRNAADAEQLKARLALLGSVASIQTVTVNEKTWHRVRLGPYEGARKADDMRRMLADNQIETLVMKVNP